MHADLDGAFPLGQTELRKHMEVNMSQSATIPVPVSASAPSPEHILQLGLSFWASKTLLSAVEMEVFTELAKQYAGRAAGPASAFVAGFF